MHTCRARQGGDSQRTVWAVPAYGLAGQHTSECACRSTAASRETQLLGVERLGQLLARRQGVSAEEAHSARQPARTPSAVHRRLTPRRTASTSSLLTSTSS